MKRGAQVIAPILQLFRLFFYKPTRSLQTTAEYNECFVLAEEQKIVRESRRRAAKLNDERESEVDEQVGLALSGGGIRSAAFHLGVVQALAREKLLYEVDYISAVSGGGFIAGWLIKLIEEHGRRNAEARITPTAGQHACPEIERMRAGAAYLTPQTGLMSPDIGLLGTTYFHNLVLNLLTCLLLLMFAISLPRIVLAALKASRCHTTILAYVGGVFALGTTFNVVLRLFARRSTRSTYIPKGIHDWAWWAGIFCSGICFAIADARIQFARGAFASVALILLFWPHRHKGKRRFKWGLESQSDPVRLGLQGVPVIGVLCSMVVLSSWLYLLDTSGFYPQWPWVLLTAVAWTRVTHWVWERLQMSDSARRNVLAIPAVVAGFLMTACWFFNTPDPISLNLDISWPQARTILANVQPIARYALYGAFGLSTVLLVLVLSQRVVAPWRLTFIGRDLIAMCGVAGMGLLSGYRGQQVLFSWLAKWKCDLGTEAAFTPVMVIFAPILISAGTLIVSILVAIIGRIVSPFKRERISALASALYGFTWVWWFCVAGVSIYGPIAVYTASRELTAALCVLWIISIGAGFAAQRIRSSRIPLWRQLKQAFALVSPYIFFLGLVVGAALLFDYSVLRIRWQSYGLYLKDLFDSYNGYTVIAGSALGWLSVLLSARFGINMSSMHMFYQSRLADTFLDEKMPGAHPVSYPPEKQSDGDDTRMHRRFRLVHLEDFKPRAQGPYDGPLPIFNAALNLSGSRDPRHRERKAANFIFTPLFCGYDVRERLHRTGVRPRLNSKRRQSLQRFAYARTAQFGYGEDPGVRLALAIAISGSALGSNMGRYTSTRRRFLNTVFNLRLGWWMSNPRYRDAWRHPMSRARVTMLVAEFFGLIDDAGPFVNLSDGGHFENLGLYELVRRRCRVVIVSDASEDRLETFASLGSAVERCRVDFGVNVEINLNQITARSQEWLIGRIDYGSERPQGLLVYLRSSNLPIAPADVFSYGRLHHSFPHHPTVDQWFNESQFESYRELGFRIGQSFTTEIKANGLDGGSVRTRFVRAVENTAARL